MAQAWGWTCMLEGGDACMRVWGSMHTGMQGRPHQGAAGFNVKKHSLAHGRTHTTLMDADNMQATAHEGWYTKCIPGLNRVGAMNGCDHDCCAHESRDVKACSLSVTWALDACLGRARLHACACLLHRCEQATTHGRL